MPVDKSWMKVKNCLSREYRNGVKEFVEVAKAHVNAEGKTRCPCMNCLNGKFQAPSAVEMHLIQKGIQPSYTVWSYHGESFNNPQADHVKDDGDEMADVVADKASNTPTESLNDPAADHSRQHSKFDDTSKEMERELYPGCKKISAQKFLEKLNNLKVVNKWSDESYDMLLKLVNDMLPAGSNLLTSHNESKTKLRDVGGNRASSSSSSSGSREKDN